MGVFFPSCDKPGQLTYHGKESIPVIYLTSISLFVRLSMIHNVYSSTYTYIFVGVCLDSIAIAEGNFLQKEFSVRPQMFLVNPACIFIIISFCIMKYRYKLN
jgi:hypothetical protein